MGATPAGRRAGFTLLEVMVAAGLLAVGVSALLQVQVLSLQAQRRVHTMREVVNVAESEVERRVAAALPGGAECSASADAGSWLESCWSRVERCAVAEAPCGGASADRAQRVTVAVSGRGGLHFELSVIAARFPP